MVTVEKIIRKKSSCAPLLESLLVFPQPTSQEKRLFASPRDEAAEGRTPGDLAPSEKGGYIGKGRVKAVEGEFRATLSRRLTRAAHLASPPRCVNPTYRCTKVRSQTNHWGRFVVCSIYLQNQSVSILSSAHSYG